MQKRLIHHLLLLMALIFGSGAAAPPLAEPQANGVLVTHPLHLLQCEFFEQVGLVEVGHSRLKKRLYRLPIAGFTMLGSPPAAARPERCLVEA